METAWERKDRLAKERKTYQELADLALREIDEALAPPDENTKEPPLSIENEGPDLSTSA